MHPTLHAPPFCQVAGAERCSVNNENCRPVNPGELFIAIGEQCTDPLAAVLDFSLAFPHWNSIPFPKRSPMDIFPICNYLGSCFLFWILGRAWQLLRQQQATSHSSCCNGFNCSYQLICPSLRCLAKIRFSRREPNENAVGT